MNKKTIALIGTLALVATGVLLILLNQKNESENIKVGIFLQAPNQIIEDIKDGFIERLAVFEEEKGVKIELIEKNANGDQMQMDLIANYFMNSDVDLIFAVGATAIQTLKNKQCKKTVIFGAPPDAIGLGFVPRHEDHGTNFTGTTYFPPTKIIVDVFMDAFPNATTVAVLRNPAEANSAAVAKSFMENAKLKGLKVIDLPSMDGAQVDASLRSLETNQADGLFIPTDNLLHAMLERVLSTTNKMNLPVFSCTKLTVEDGALFSIGTDYKVTGELSADVAYPILFENKSPQEVDVMEINTGSIYLNSTNPAAKNIKELSNYKIEIVK
jgi:putative ABC transport system substrate-binding protein